MQVFISGANTLAFIKITLLERGSGKLTLYVGEIAFLNHIFCLCVFFIPLSRLLAEEKTSSCDSGRRCAKEYIYKLE